MRGFTYAIAAAAISLSASGSALASEMVYRPVNPNFGGNALNGGYLMQNAQAQGKAAKQDQQQQFPDINFPDLSGVGGGGTSPIIIIGGNGQTQIPANP